MADDAPAAKRPKSTSGEETYPHQRISIEVGRKNIQMFKKDLDTNRNVSNSGGRVAHDAW